MSWLWQSTLLSEAILQPTGENIALEGSINAKSIINGTIPLLDRKILSDLHVQSTVGAALNRNVKDSSQVSGDSDFDGNTNLAKGLVSDLRARSSFTGNLTVEHETPILEGSIRAVSRLGADVYKASNNQSSDSSSARFNGLVTLIKNIVGQINGKSTLGAAAANKRGEQSSVAGDSEFDGNLSSGKSIVGQIRGQSSLSGQLNLSRNLVGQIYGKSSLSGRIDRASNIVSIISTSSTLNSQENVKRDLDVDLFGRSTFSATLTVGRAVPINGGIFAKSILGADVNKLAGFDSGDNSKASFNGLVNIARSLLSRLSSNSSSNGQDNLHRELDVDLFARSSFSGSLDKQGIVVLDGALFARSTLGFADIKLGRNLDNDTFSSAYLTGSLSNFRHLVGQINGRSSWSGLLFVDRPAVFVAGISAQSRLGVDVSVNRSITGNFTNQNEWDALLLNDRQLIASLNNQGILGGVLLDSKLIVSDLRAISRFGANLTVVSIPTNFETVNFTLNVLTQRNIGNLLVKTNQDIVLNTKTQFEFTLER